MPQAIVPFIASALGGGVIAGAVANLLVGVAFSALSQALLSPDKPTLKRPGIRTEFAGTGDVTPQSIILGRYATPGHEMAPAYTHSRQTRDAWDDVLDAVNGVEQTNRSPDEFYGTVGKGKILTLVRSLSDAPVAGLAAIYVDGVKFNYPEDFEPREKYGMGPKAGLSEEKEAYRDSMSVEFFDGTQTEPSAYLRGAYGNHPTRPWGEDAVHRGAAYVVVSFDLDYDLFTSEPKLLFEVNGLPLLDPRTGIVGPTNNPAIMAWHVYQTIPFGSDRFGVGLPRAFLPDAVWHTAMNVCDVQVPSWPVGTTEPQYRAGYEIKIAQPDMGGDEPLDIIDVMLRAMAGQVAEIGGDVHIRAGAPGLPVVAMTDDDILGSEPEAHSPIVGISSIHNSVAAQYPDPTDNWSTRDAKTVTDEAAVARLGEVRQGGVDLSAVPYRRQVSRLMRAWLDDAQRHRAHTFTLPARWAATMVPLAVFAWSSDAYAYTNKLFEVQEAVHDVATGQVAVTVREVDPNDWDVGNAELAPERDLAPPVTFIEPFNLGTIELYPAIAVDANGVSRRPGIRATWDAAGRNLGAVEVEYRLRGLTVATVMDSTPDGRSGGLTTFDGILPNTEYEGRAKGIVRGSSTWTDWVPVLTADVGLTEEDLSIIIRNKLQDAEDVRDLALIGFVEAETANEKADKIVEDLGPNLDEMLADVEKAKQDVADVIAIIDDSGSLIDSKIGELRDDIAATDLVTVSRLDALGVRVSTEVGARSAANLALGVRIDTVAVEVDDAKALVQQESAARIADDEALAAQITTVAVSVGDVDARLTSQAVAWADADSALGQRIDAIVVQAGDGTGTVQDEAIARADADLALGARITTVTATMGANKAEADTKLLALATKDTSLSTRIDTVVASIGTVDARVTSQSIARANADSALAGQINNIVAWVHDVNASVTTEVLARASEDDAIVTGLNFVKTRVGATEATIAEHTLAISTQDTAVAKLQTDLNATVGQTNANITKTDQVVAQVNGFASAYSGVTVTTSGGGVAGFKATSWNNPGGTSGAVLDLLGSVVRAGTLLADSLITGQGRNLLEDSDFAQGPRNWRLGRVGAVGDQSVLAIVPAGQPYSGLADPVMSLRQFGTGTTGSAYAFAMGVNPATQAQTDMAVACEPGDVFFASARMLPVACTAHIGIRFFDASGTPIKTSPLPIPTSAAEPNRPPRRWLRRSVRSTAPAGAAYVQMFFAKDGRSAGSVSALYWYQPQLEVTHGSASEPTPYGRSGVTLIDGGQVVTGTLYAEAVNTASFSAAGLAIFGGDVRSENYTPGRNGAGWAINQNGNAQFGTLQLRAGSVTNAVVGDLTEGGNLSINCGAGGNLIVLMMVYAQFSPISPSSFSGTLTLNGVERLTFSGSSLQSGGGGGDTFSSGLTRFRILQIPTNSGGVFTVRATVNAAGSFGKGIEVMLLEAKR